MGWRVPTPPATSPAKCSPQQLPKTRVSQKSRLRSAEPTIAVPGRSVAVTRRTNKLIARTDGFTLTEVLITILLIGVLAAIVVPMFSSQRGKAQDANAKSLARAGA